ncbi:MAG TPA: translation initiation factor IF-6 [Methanocorpusculum sp.]|nr:translation initiation factor IF-6 [Methanocorpusculum sp.]HJJ57756.1 translation initiation factor IF-6 [Methanocorpusculum sp.]HJJ95440.1 translation initiation factor IF-6 [Methanocorpusculum sp.]
MDPTLSLNGDPNIGVFARAFDEVAFVPIDCPEEFKTKIAERLDVDVVETFIQGSSVIGLLLTGNSNGFVVSGLIQDSELDLLQEYNDVLLLGEEMNAAGNVILANDSFALVHPDMSSEMRRIVGEFLKVPTIPISFAGVGTVGMTCAISNNGILLPAKSSPEEIANLESQIPVADFPVGTGSVNMGSNLIGAGMIINNKGYLAGNTTSGFELGRIEDVFGFE